MVMHTTLVLGTRPEHRTKQWLQPWLRLLAMCVLLGLAAGAAAPVAPNVRVSAEESTAPAATATEETTEAAELEAVLAQATARRAGG